jgi:predicted metal-dependent peptidase
MTIQTAIIELIVSSNAFYASFLAQCNRKIDYNLPAPAGISVTDSINLYINPTLFDAKSLEVQQAILKHEVLHLINEHCSNKASSFGVDHSQLNIAMDVAINQLEGLEPIMQANGYWTLENFKKACEKYIEPDSIKAKMDFQYYLRIIKQCQNEFDESQGESPDDHSKMEESGEGEEKKSYKYGKGFQQQIVKDATGRAMAQSAGSVGIDLKKLIDAMFSSKVDWKRQLTRIVSNAVNIKKTTTRMRLNRRYGLMSPGKKKDYVMKIGYILDTSGSMSSFNLAQGWGEMAKLQALYPDMEIILYECDANVQPGKKFAKKLKPEITGGGGTDMNPAFVLAKEEGVDLIVCFTDGDFYEKIDDPKIPTIFCIDGKNSYSYPFGKVICLGEPKDV